MRKKKMFGLKTFKLGEVPDMYELPTKTQTRLKMKKVTTKPIKPALAKKKRNV